MYTPYKQINTVVKRMILAITTPYPRYTKTALNTNTDKNPKVQNKAFLFIAPPPKIINIYTDKY